MCNILMRENSEGEATEEVCVAAIDRCMYRMVERGSDRGILERENWKERATEERLCRGRLIYGSILRQLER